MKRLLFFVSILAVAFTISACVETPENTDPTISGVSATATIDLGDSFDALDGVSAADEEDGDLTASITVSASPSLTFTAGVVTPEAAGDYVITYSVEDSEGASATATCTLTVEEEPVVADPLTSNFFEYAVYGGDGVAVVNFIVFYDNGVFYYSKYNGAQVQAGYYELETGGPWDYLSNGNDFYNPAEETVTVTARLLFFDQNGDPLMNTDNEQMTAGWIESELRVVANGIYGGGRDFVVNENSTLTDSDIQGVIFGQYTLEGDDYSELLIKHNGTFTDTVNLLIEGTWTFADGVYTLTPEDGDPYTFTPSEDGLTGAYVNGTYSATLYAPIPPEVLYTLSGSLDEDSGTMLIYDDGSIELAIIYGGAELSYEGSWVEEDNGDLTITVSSLNYTATKLDEGVYSLDFDVQEITLVLTNAVAGPQLLFSWANDSSQTLDFYDDGSYIYEYADYSIVEEGTFSFTSWTLTITQSNDNVITAVMDGTTYEFSLAYVAVINAQLATTFTVDSVTWGTALGATGEYVPFVYGYPQELFSWANDSSQTLVFYDDGTYVYEYADYSIVEEGTFSFTGWTLTITQANDNVITAAMDGTTYEFSLAYVAVINAQLATTFTVDSTTWGMALGATGEYVPVNYVQLD